MDFLFANWDVLACVSTWKGADTWESADTCRHVKVPTRADIRHTNHMDFFICKLRCAGMCQHLKKCWHLRRCRHVPTRLGADTCRHVPTSLILIIWTFCLQTGMCWHVSAPEKVPTPGKVPTRADTSRCRHVPTRADIRHTNHMDFFICKLRCAGMCQHLKKCWHLRRCRHVPTRLGADTCRHVPTSLILIIWTFCLQTGMCWHVSAPEKVPTPGKVPTRADTSTCRHVPTRADIRHTNHMYFFICKLRCAGMCQHLKKWWHLRRCRHVPTRLGADTCRHPWY